MKDSLQKKNAKTEQIMDTEKAYLHERENFQSVIIIININK